MKFEPKDSIFQYIHVDPGVFSKEMSKKSLYYSNIIIWMVIFFYPLLGILDYVYAHDVYQTLILIKVISVLAIYAVYDICARIKTSPLIALHMTFATIAVNAAILCNIVPFEVAPIFFLLYASLFMLFNLTVFWPASYSFIHFFATLIMIFIAFRLFNNGSIQVFISQGAGLFIMTGFFSCFIPVVRYSIIKRNAMNDLAVKNSTALLQELHKDLYEKNLVIESSNTQLTEIVMQQEHFFSVLKHDIKELISINNLEAVEIGQIGEQEANHFKGAEESISKLEHLIQHFPDEQGELIPDGLASLTPVNIEETLVIVAKSMEKQFSRAGIDFSFIPSGRNYTIQLDQLYYEQFLYNILANCLRFSSGGNKLVASVRNQDNKISLNLKSFHAEENLSLTSMGKLAINELAVSRLLAKKINTRLSLDHGAHYFQYEITFDQQLSV